jgi:hypothetical protein
MGRIPEHEYIKQHGYRAVTFQLIELYHTPSEVEVFNTWFAGQTWPILEDGTYAVYVDDYERWLSEGRLDHQLSHNWD